MKKMPVLFVGHGSLMNVLDKENPFNQNLSLITQKFAKPKAILMIALVQQRFAGFIGRTS
nr:hypothetical protein [Aggregatibacter kilianii]